MFWNSLPYETAKPVGWSFVMFILVVITTNTILISYCHFLYYYCRTYYFLIIVRIRQTGNTFVIVLQKINAKFTKNNLIRLRPVSMVQCAISAIIIEQCFFKKYHTFSVISITIKYTQITTIAR